MTLLNVPELKAVTGPASVEFPENSWSRVATFTASSEEDRAGIDWVLAGTDSDHFSIDSPPGALRFALPAVAPRIFSEPPDFEAPVDGDGANTYELVLLAQAGSSVTDTHVLTVTVTDVAGASATWSLPIDIGGGKEGARPVGGQRRAEDMECARELGTVAVGDVLSGDPGRRFAERGAGRLAPAGGRDAHADGLGVVAGVPGYPPAAVSVDPPA